MGKMNLYYKAFAEYRKFTLKDKQCIRQRQIIAQYPSETDKIEAVRNTCIINKDWVEEIERLLPFVERAIAEERQFIKNEGEVLEIEKIRRVSKESVEHLARHSEFLTHVPEEDDGDLIPDKIFMVERLSDFAVYENRFLYMLLCYLRDFIQLRLKKIKDFGNLYEGRIFVKREIVTQNGTLSFETKLIETIKNDELSKEQEEFNKMIERIESSLHVVVSLLLKPLMVMVAKTPMLKPPITKTNVLKMNNKFKNALHLYEYLVAYEGDGFEIKEQKRTIHPFTEDVIDDVSELINLTSFLTYQYGNGIKPRLKEEYLSEIKEEERKQRDKIVKRLDEIKKKYEMKKLSGEDYIFALEEAVSTLKQYNSELKVKEKELYKLTDEYVNLNSEYERIEKRFIQSENEKREKIEFIEKQTEVHRVQLLEAEQKRLSDLEAQSTRLNLEFTERFNLAKEEAEKMYSELSSKHSDLAQKYYLTSARLHSKAESEELTEEDYKKEENFVELEKEFIAFYDMFIEKWKGAKKQIRKEMLWSKFKKVRAKIATEE